MSKSKQQDEILYCARCGISFVWTQEEQRQVDGAGADKPPPVCPGCRQLMPPADRARGMVKWYDPRKQYGFIVRAGQPDLYVHRSAVQSARPLQPGDLVEFAVEATPRGPAADQVEIVEPAN